nr:MAG TPA: hypothetical protein [Caudoviricetes sp.]
MVLQYHLIGKLKVALMKTTLKLEIRDLILR